MGNNIENIKEIEYRLSSLVNPLESILKGVEPNFLQLGQILESIHSEANKITQLTLKATQVAGEESDQNLLSDVAGLAERSLKQLEKSSTDVFENLQNVETGMKYLDKLQRSVPLIRGIAKTLKMVSLNTAVESSRSRKCEEIFSFFVEEIKELSKRVNVISRDIRDDSEASQIKQLDILNDVIARRNQLQKIAATADDMIKDNINRIKHLFEVSREKLKESMNHSKEISRHIGEVIESIQFEDITRQQIEHIIDAIQDTERRCTGESCPGDDPSVDSEMLSQIHSVLNIQAAQIEQVISEIREAHEKILNSFSEISNLIDLLVEGTADFSLRESVQSEMGTPFEELVSGFANLNIILEQGHNLSKKIEEAMSRSAEIALKLSSHISKVEEVSLDLHIKAINAIVMSNRLGAEGIAHAVLAKNVTDVSKESNDFVTEVVEIIDSISKSTKGLNRMSEDGAKTGNSGKESHESSLTSSLDKISNAYKKFQEDSSLAFEHSRALKETISQAESGLSFLQEMADGLSECLENFDLTIQSLDPQEKQRHVKEKGLNHISEKYTMKIERDIHKKVFEKTDQTPWDPGKRVNEEGNDFGDNVELF